jgi:hypothetical protein
LMYVLKKDNHMEFLTDTSYVYTRKLPVKMTGKSKVTYIKNTFLLKGLTNQHTKIKIVTHLIFMI